MENLLGMSEANTITKDLAKKRIVFDEECVTRAYDLLKEWGTPFKENDCLVNISSGVACDTDIESDMIGAEKKGESALHNFIKNRIVSNKEDIHDPIPKLKLKTFASMKAKRSCKIKDKSLTLKADRDVFARLLVVSGKRNISLKEVLKYSLGPIPWSLATAEGSFVKTPKSKLLDAIENDAHDPLVAALPERSVRVFDGMVLLQQLTSVSLSTFGEVSEYLLKRITSSPAKIIYFVTDQYKDDSIKGSEPQRRASSVIRIQISRREQKRPKQFKKYLGHGCNKVDLVKFLLLDWSDLTRFKQIISGRVIFVTIESDCHRI